MKLLGYLLVGTICAVVLLVLGSFVGYVLALVIYDLVSPLFQGP